jgi:hypothetical protein
VARAAALRDEVLELKHEILRHAVCDNELIGGYLRNEALQIHDRSRHSPSGTCGQALHLMRAV